MRTFRVTNKNYRDEWDHHAGVVFDDDTIVVNATSSKPYYNNTFVFHGKGEGAVQEYYAGIASLGIEWDPGSLAVKRFQLRRLRDVTGVSGEGVVAQGLEFPDGTAVVRWIVGPYNSTVLWASVSEAVQVHGHDGNTVLEWVD